VPVVATAPAGIAPSVKGRPLIAVVVDSIWLPQLGDIVDALDQNRKPGPTPPLLVVTRESALADQLLGMTGSADAFVTNADAAGVLHKIGDLQRALSSAEPLRVLIVDDDRSQVVFCDAVLRRRGLTTQVAMSSREALELVPAFRPDLILVDLYMPDIDGMALTARIREMPGTLLLPIVFISGEQDVGKRVCAINVGADDFLTKPIRPAHLIDVVVGRAKRARALRRQVLGSPQEAHTGPLARSALAVRIRDLADRPAALISVGLEQSEALSSKLPTLLRCEIEQALAGRIAARVQPGDAFGPWNDLHFLVLAARPDEASLRQLMQSFKSGIDVRPVVISRGQIKVSARVQLSMADGDLQRWLDRALAGWSQPRRAVDATRPAPLPAAATASEEPAASAQAPNAALCHAEYQPLIPARGLRPDQWQQRLRMRSDAQQVSGVLRADLVDAARRAGTLATLDRIALRLALDTVSAQLTVGRRLRIQVEVDVGTLIDPGFVSFLEAECQATLRNEPALMLELDTEAVIERQAQVRPVLERLRQFGVQVCLREFGLQKEAPRLLQHFNVDAVKLDTDLALQPSMAFATILAQIRESGVPIEVEEVPDRHAISKLWELGVDYIQCDLLRPYGQSVDYDFRAQS
jgi:DNA-binding response OmpR family regulator/EAL domain-containing protein (putative c-di-GMP-specific phosphodiesterase class I)